MSLLAWILAFILGITCLFFVLVSKVGQSGVKRVPRFLCLAYAWIVFTALFVAISSFVGLGKHTSPKVPPEMQRRIQHSGYYTASGADAEFLFVGEARQNPSEDDEAVRHETTSSNRNAQLNEPNAFQHSALAVDEKISLKPDWDSVAQKYNVWTLRYFARSYPLRVAGRCINIPADQWFKPGDSLFVYSNSGNVKKFFSVQWKTSSRWLGGIKNYYYYSQGTCNGPEKNYEIQDALISDKVLEDGRTLSVMARIASGDFKNLYKIDQDWWDVFEGITWVRESRRQKESPIGVLVSEALFQNPNLEIYKNATKLEATNSEAEGRVPFNSPITYGIGYKNLLALSLTNSVMSDPVWGEIFEVHFTTPQTWPLPPRPQEPFIITSSNDYIPVDGYLINMGDTVHPFYAKATLNDTHAALQVNDGTKKDNYELGKPIRLGDYKQGVIVSLESIQASVEYAGWKAIAAIFAGTLLFTVITLAEKDSRLKLDLAWALIWGISLTILVVRLILSYRVSLLPPDDATPLEISNVFDKSLSVSLLTLWVLPLVYLSVGLLSSPFMLRYIARSRSADFISTLWKRARTFISNWWRKNKRSGGARAPRKARKTKPISFFSKRGLLNFLTRERVPITLWLIAGLLLLIGRFVGSENEDPSLIISIPTYLSIIAGFVITTWRVSRYLYSKYGVVSLAWEATVLWVIVGKTLGSTESFLGLRMNIIAHFLIILALALSTRNAITHKKQGHKAMALWFMGLTIVLMILFVRDTGFVIYSISLAIFATLLLLWGKQKVSVGMITSASVVVILFLFLSAGALIVKAGWLQKINNPSLRTVFYRLVSYTETEKEILLTRGDESELNMDMFLRNSHQNWQMLLYAAEGIKNPRGYGQVPLTNRGMTYPTSMADCMFSTYVLSEHGKWAGFLLVLVYLALGALCFYGSWYFPQGKKYRGLILVAIGSFFVCNTLYMAAANVGLVPFTGQNIPLLSLYSGSDLLQGAMMLGLISLLLRANLKSSSDKMLDDQKAVRVAGVVFLAAISLFCLFLFIRMGELSAKENYTEDHNFDSAVYESLKQDLPDSNQPDKSTPLMLEGEMLVPQRGSQPQGISEQFVKQFNERSNKLNENGGVLYLQRESPGGGQSRYVVKINKRYFKMRSPFNKPSLWAGLITARGEENGPTLSALGHAFTVSLSNKGHAESIALNETPPMSATQKVAIKESRRGNIFCEMFRNGDDLTITYKPPKDWTVFVDGESIHADRILKPHDLIVIQKGSSQKGTLYRWNLIYLGLTPPVLGYVQWRNGDQKRVFPRGDFFPMAYTIGKAGDHAVAMGQNVSNVLSLSLNVSLQRSLQKAVEKYARGNSRYKVNDPLRTNRLAVASMDAFSGEVLAMPSWPYANINGASFEQSLIEATPGQQIRLLNNHNLTNHVIGSTIKPLIFSALATQFWPEHDLAALIVHNRAGEGKGSNGESGHYHLKIGNIPLEEGWDCNSASSPTGEREFLIHSYDYHEGVLGMLGMLMSKNDWGNVLKATTSQSQADIRYNNADYAFNMRNVSDSPFLLKDLLKGDIARLLTSTERTLLFRALPDLYDARLSDEDKFYMAEACARFLPSFSRDYSPSSQNEYLDNVLPALVNLGPRRLDFPRRDLISFLLGGGECRWNNIRMAEAGARLATGQRIIATLESHSQQPRTAQTDSPFSNSVMPAPVNDRRWRNNYLIEPMERVGIEGTASSLASLRASLPASYRIIYKTGTIQEDDGDRESEALLFVIGKWQNESFVPGKTLACFLYMQNSKKKEQDAMKKFDFARPVITELIKHLKTQEQP